MDTPREVEYVKVENPRRGKTEERYTITRENGSKALHREDGPASIETYHSPQEGRYGAIKIERWYRDGELTREDAPAVIYTLEDGTVVREEWWSHGSKHRNPEEGPAVSAFFPSGAVATVEFVVQGAEHRTGGEPSRSDYLEEGTLYCERWCEHGKLHRNPEEGPAVIFYSPLGVVFERGYFLRGERVKGAAHPGTTTHNITTGAMVRREFVLDDAKGYRVIREYLNDEGEVVRRTLLTESEREEVEFEGSLED